MKLSLESLRTKIARVNLLEKVKKQFVSRSLASVFFLGVLFPTVLPISSAAPSLAEEESKPTVVTMDSTSADLVKVQMNKSQITPGESQVGKAEREKAESDYRAKAEAEASAKAEADKVAKSRETISREGRTYSDPSNFDSIYARAEAQYGVDARILKAVHIVETGASGSSGVANASGATGPMQFIRSTWRAYGVDGNGDGVADITNVEDAIFAAARYLKACGYPDARKALYGYNPSTSYYNKVMGIARSMGF